MTAPLQVIEDEREVVRVFALDLDPSAVGVYATPPAGNGASWALQEALGATSLDPAHVEVFPASDLKGVGLPAYLIDGQGIDEATIAPDRDALDAEQGHIVIVLSKAFGGNPQILNPKPPLRHIGTYRMAEAEAPRAAVPSPDETTPTATRPTAPPGPPSRGASLVVLLGILGAAVALLAVVFYFRSQPFLTPDARPQRPQDVRPRRDDRPACVVCAGRCYGLDRRLTGKEAAA